MEKNLNEFNENFTTIEEKSESALNKLNELKNEIKVIKPELEKLTREIQANIERLSTESIRNIEQRLEVTKKSTFEKLNEIDQLANQQIGEIEKATQRIRAISVKRIDDIGESADGFMIKQQEEIERIKAFFSNEAMKQISLAKKIGRLSLIISFIAIFTLFIFVYIGKQTFPDKWEKIYSLNFYGNKMKPKSSRH